MSTERDAFNVCIFIICTKPQFCGKKLQIAVIDDSVAKQLSKQIYDERLFLQSNW